MPLNEKKDRIATLYPSSAVYYLHSSADRVVIHILFSLCNEACIDVLPHEVVVKVNILGMAGLQH